MVVFLVDLFAHQPARREACLGRMPKSRTPSAFGASSAPVQASTKETPAGSTSANSGERQGETGGGVLEIEGGRSSPASL